MLKFNYRFTYKLNFLKSLILRMIYTKFVDRLWNMNYNPLIDLVLDFLKTI